MSDFSLNILVVEDNLSLALELEMLVKEMGYNVIGRVDNSAEALEMIFSKSPDLILMDIDIKGNLSGVQIADKIRHLNIPVIFITGNNTQAHYDEAAKTNNIGFLIKPVNKFTLLSTINTFFKKLSLAEQKSDTESEMVLDEKEEIFPLKDFLFFKKRGLLHKISIPDILYVSADDNYTVTVTEKGEFLSALRLFEIEEILNDYSFIKTHRSYLINIDKIDSIDSGKSIINIGSKEIPISRANRVLVLEKIQLLR